MTRRDRAAVGIVVVLAVAVGAAPAAAQPSATDARFLDFTANVQFLADLPTDGIGNFIALNSVPGGLTNSSFTGGFYSVVP